LETVVFSGVYKEEDLPEAAEKYLSALDGTKVILLTGELGAGKTTLARHLLLAAGVDEIITSPTFTLCNTYEIQGARLILHSDLYRIESVPELEQTGFFELLDNAALAVIEWGESLKYLLASYVEINILINGKERYYVYGRYNRYGK
jgi:tRNA threonylcarbamoyladenosine biosynthesis protein TsaE